MSASRSVVAVAVTLVAAGLPAHAETRLELGTPSLTSEQMSALMHTYVEGEREAAVPFGATGALTLTSGALLLAQGHPVGRGAAWPLLTVGAIEAAAGVLLAAARGSSYTGRLDRRLAEDPAEFARSERHHLHLIRDRYQPILLVAEGILAVGGGAMAMAGGGGHGNGTLEGVGIGIAAQSMAMFVLDWAVLDRARAYARGLSLFLPDAGNPL